MIYLFLADGFEEIEALAFVDIMRRADIDIKTVSIYSQNERPNNLVTGSHNIKVCADLNADTVDFSDLKAVVLPGGLPGTTNLANSKLVLEVVTKAYKENKYIGAICAAPSALGKFGILNGHKATCFPGYEDKLTGATVVNERVVVSGNIVTSRAAGTTHDFAFEFVKIFKGKELADEIRNKTLY